MTLKDSQGNRIGTAFAPLATISSPATTILIVEGWPAASDPEEEQNGQPERHEIAWVLGQRDAVHNALQDGNPRHASGFNDVLCDGHAKWRQRQRQADAIFTGGTKDSEWLALK